MRLPMFDMMDTAAALLDRRREFYQSCTFELQELITKTLADNALLSVNARVKSNESLREKILRKHLYKKYDNPYDLLNNLSDLVGLRAECRFLREEALLYEALCNACTINHGNGMFSIPTHPNIRFFLSANQPETQQNGLNIYRVDGKYHKNGVTAPFELQIKALVHVFWAEVEHQLIYKNHTYVPMDSFIKKLLYSNYDSLQQIDQHLQLIYDYIQKTPTHFETGAQYSNIHAMLAKTLSDVFTRTMQGEIGFSMRMDKITDILARYLIAKYVQSGSHIGDIFQNLRHAMKPISFDDTLDLGGVLDTDDPFCSTIGLFLIQQLNMDYEWNLFFRLLFAVEDAPPIETFHHFILLYRNRFAEPSLYQHYDECDRNARVEEMLSHICAALVQHGELTMFHEEIIVRILTKVGALTKKEAWDGERIRMELMDIITDQY